MRNDRRVKLIRLSQAAGSVVDDVEFFPGPGRRTVGEQRGGTGAFGAEVAARAGAVARIGAAKSDLGSVVDDVEFFPGPGRRTVGEQRGGTGAFGAEVAARAGAVARIGAAKA